ncbi:MAG: hypothetical protein R3C12_12460 [Planctomycetaceae bacterium]
MKTAVRGSETLPYIPQAGSFLKGKPALGTGGGWRSASSPGGGIISGVWVFLVFLN